MRQSNGYIVKTIAGVPYILPYAQNIADHKRGVQLNETGVFLWKELEQEQTEDELADKFIQHIRFEGNAEEAEEIRRDIRQFLEQLVRLGIVEDGENVPEEPVWKYVNIGGLCIRLAGRAEVFSGEFAAFEVQEHEAGAVDMTIQVHNCFPRKHRNGTLLLRNKELAICEREEDYLVLFPMAEKILEADVSKDGTHAEFYCLPPYSDQLRYDLFHAIRLVYLCRAQLCGMYALHSASILYRGKAWLFSGPSGTGKSTHTNLWREAFHTPVINGDLNLIALTEDGPVVHGMPWCGTSEISDTNTYPLGGIILLKQHPEDVVVELPEDKQALYVMQRLISPAWTEKQMLSNIGFVEQLVKEIYVGRLLCTKETHAAEVMKARIDESGEVKTDDKDSDM